MILGWLAVAGVVVLLGLAGGIVLAALEVPAGGVLVEPGCGDGRVLAAVLRRDGSVRVTGIERDPVMLAVARLRAGRKARLRLGDMRTGSLIGADRVFTYLSPRFMALLEPKFERELKPGARVVSLQFALPSRKASREIELKQGPAHARRLYVYDY
jgi:SAM-dependent methyltransferase